jgi:hypothetical protein
MGGLSFDKGSGPIQMARGNRWRRSSSVSARSGASQRGSRAASKRACTRFAIVGLGEKGCERPMHGRGRARPPVPRFPTQQPGRRARLPMGTATRVCDDGLPSVIRKVAQAGRGPQAMVRAKEKLSGRYGSRLPQRSGRQTVRAAGSNASLLQRPNIISYQGDGV